MRQAGGPTPARLNPSLCYFQLTPCSLQFCREEEEKYRSDASASWQLRVLGYVVVDRRKYDCSLLEVDWSEPKVLLKCFGDEMGLCERQRGDVVKKGSIPVGGACQNNAPGVVDRFWISELSDPMKMDSTAKTIEKFSNNADPADRMLAHATKSGQKCKSKFALSGRLSHPDLHYAEIAVVRMKRKMATAFDKVDERDSLSLLSLLKEGGVETKKMQVVAVAPLYRARSGDKSQGRIQEPHMDR